MHEDLNDGGYEYWPVNRADLDPHYDRVEKMIGLQRFPVDHEPYASTPKTIAFKEAAERIGLEWFLPEAGGHVRQRGPRRRSRARRSRRSSRTSTAARARPARLCGECDVGCNYGAKNTLDYNYLTHAKHHGAEIRTLCDVRRFEPRDGGGYARRTTRDLGDERRERARPTVDADVRPPDPQRGHARHDQPAAAQPQRVPGPLAQARHALLRQRRPADAGR